MHLQILKLDLWFSIVWKVDFKYLKIYEFVLQIIVSFSLAVNIDVVNI